MSLLEIKNLHATVAGKEILRGIDLTVNAGEVHAIMGPNGSGKSTLAQVLAGRDLYQVTEGTVEPLSSRVRNDPWLRRLAHDAHLCEEPRARLPWDRRMDRHGTCTGYPALC